MVRLPRVTRGTHRLVLIDGPSARSGRSRAAVATAWLNAGQRRTQLSPHQQTHSNVEHASQTDESPANEWRASRFCRFVVIEHYASRFRDVRIQRVTQRHAICLTKFWAETPRPDVLEAVSDDLHSTGSQT
jgi:hypothetical protein